MKASLQFQMIVSVTCARLWLNLGTRRTDDIVEDRGRSCNSNSSSVGSRESVESVVSAVKSKMICVGDIGAYGRNILD